MTDNPYEAPQSSVINNQDCPPLFNPFVSSIFGLLFFMPFACVLHAMNWKALGDEQMEKSNWIAAGVITLICIILLFLDFKFSGLILLLVWYFTLGKKQQDFVKENFGNDYPRRNMWLAALVGLGVTILWIVLAFAILVIFSPSSLVKS